MQAAVTAPPVQAKPIIITIKTPEYTPSLPRLIRSPVKSLSNLCIAADTPCYYGYIAILFIGGQRAQLPFTPIFFYQDIWWL